MDTKKELVDMAMSTLQDKDTMIPLTVVAGQILGRILYWSERRRRRPKWWELALEPVVICVLTIFALAILEQIGITSVYAAGCLGSLCAFYGVKTIDTVSKAVARRLGIPDPCSVEVKVPEEEK
jgi:amino acid transporter